MSRKKGGGGPAGTPVHSQPQQSEGVGDGEFVAEIGIGEFPAGVVEVVQNADRGVLPPLEGSDAFGIEVFGALELQGLGGRFKGLSHPPPQAFLNLPVVLRGLQDIRQDGALVQQLSKKLVAPDVQGNPVHSSGLVHSSSRVILRTYTFLT